MTIGLFKSVFSGLSVILPLPLEILFHLNYQIRTTNVLIKLTTLTCLLGFIVVFLLGCSLYLLLGRTYTTPIAFRLYFKGPSLSFGLVTPYSIWEQKKFPLNKNKLKNQIFSCLCWLYSNLKVHLLVYMKQEVGK